MLWYGRFRRNWMQLQSGSWIQNLNSIALMVACTCGKILFNSLVKLQWSKEAESPYGWSEGDSPPILCRKRSSKLCNENLPKTQLPRELFNRNQLKYLLQKIRPQYLLPPKRKVIKNQDHHRSPVQTYPPWNYHNPVKKALLRSSESMIFLFPRWSHWKQPASRPAIDFALANSWSNWEVHSWNKPNKNTMYIYDISLEIYTMSLCIY